jgi:uncharacterized protein (TIGR02058 family)
MELGMGSSLRQGNYTQAAVRALKDALWHNSLSIADTLGFSKNAMIVDVEIAVQQPDQVDTDTVKSILPYGQGSVTVTHGGLDIAKPPQSPTTTEASLGSESATQANKTIIAHAAVLVSFDMERSAPSNAEVHK